MNNNAFNNTFNNMTVLVTGHTGFKGSWLSIWLTKLGAKVVGYSLEELPTNPSNFELSHLSDKITDVRGDIRDFNRLKEVIEHYKPTVVFHMAAQPIVFRSFDDPKETFDTNAGGTVNVLEAIKQTNCVKALVSITTDKVYKNKEWVWGYRENDELGDKDPYAASKGMAEFAIYSYRNCFFEGNRPEDTKVNVASTRAGNVIGGGDFADFRLIPDCMKALMENKPIELRNPAGVRPWQLVLEPLSGYLWLAVKMLNNPFGEYNKAWNFGPKGTPIEAGEVADKLINQWGNGAWINTGVNESKKESNLLMLDCSAAKQYLNWEPTYTYEETLAETADWYKEYARQKTTNREVDLYDVCSRQINKYTQIAHEHGLEWAKNA